MGEGKFKEELYYRISGGQHRLLRQRARQDDFPLLLDHYLQEMIQRFEAEARSFGDLIFRGLTHPGQSAFWLLGSPMTQRARSIRTAALKGSYPFRHRFSIIGNIRDAWVH